MDSMKVLVLGGSKNIGYHAAVGLLGKLLSPIEPVKLLFDEIYIVTDAGSTVTFLLRNPSCFDQDTTLQNHIQSGRARILKGDATVADDVRKAWVEAGRGEREGEVDLLLFTIGEPFPFTTSP